MMRRMTAAEFANQVWETLPENRFQDFIVNIAQRAGWHTYHSRKVQAVDGKWSTPIQGDKGYPDLTLSKAGRATMIWEVKTETGRVTEAQQGWLRALGVPEAAVNARMAGLWWPSGAGLCVGVVRPSMRTELADELGVKL